MPKSISTGKALTYNGDGGWLGFTDKYWASAIIPGQTEPVEARFSASGAGQPEDYQTDFVGRREDHRAGRHRRRRRRASSPAPRKSARSTITRPASASRSSI